MLTAVCLLWNGYQSVPLELCKLLLSSLPVCLEE